MSGNKSGLGRSAGLKFLLVCALVALMSIPALFMFALVYDRSSRADQVRAEIGEAVGGKQAFLGPVIAAPSCQRFVEVIAYPEDEARDVTELGKETERTPVIAPDGRLYTFPKNLDRERIDYALGRIGEGEVDGPILADGRSAFLACSEAGGTWLFFPEEGKALSRLDTDLRQKGIYQSTIYEAQLDFNASFEGVSEPERMPAGAKIDWDDAVVLVAASDLRGARSDVLVSIAGGPQTAAKPASQFGLNLSWSHWDYGGGSGGLLAVPLPKNLDRTKPFTVLADLQFTGASSIALAAFAQNTVLSMNADWPHPGFTGGFSPDSDGRAISEMGFSATWTIPSLARGVPGAAQMSLETLIDNAPVVQLVQVADPYQSVTRSLKYAMMFIGLVFLAFYVFEVVIGERLHAAQYVLVGLAQCVFYLLLLSLAEIFGFDMAFALAAGATVLLTGLYVAIGFRGGIGRALQGIVTFSAVYALLYLLMRSEDYALLVGSATAFAAVAAAMFFTRNVAWYGDSGEPRS